MPPRGAEPTAIGRSPPDRKLDSTDPNVQADWFITGDGPYATTVSIGASLLLLFVLAGIIQGTLSGDVGGMLRRIALELPVSIIGMIGLVTITQILIRLTDALSGQVLDNLQDDISEFGSVVATLATLQGQHASALVVFILGLVTVLAGLVLVADPRAVDISTLRCEPLRAFACVRLRGFFGDCGSVHEEGEPLWFATSSSAIETALSISGCPWGRSKPSSSVRFAAERRSASTHRR